MKPNILILLAHPAFDEQSVANKAMIDAVKPLENVKIMDVAKTPAAPANYYDAVKDADVVVMQFPIWWSSAPACMKEWIDVCMMPFTENPGVKGKKFMVACTTGSPESAYRAGGYDHYTVDEMLRPYQMMAEYAGFTYLTPFALYGTAGDDAASNIKKGAEAYKKLLSGLE